MSPPRLSPRNVSLPATSGQVDYLQRLVRRAGRQRADIVYLRVVGRDRWSVHPDSRYAGLTRHTAGQLIEALKQEPPCRPA